MKLSCSLSFRIGQRHRKRPDDRRADGVLLVGFVIALAKFCLRGIRHCGKSKRLLRCFTDEKPLQFRSVDDRGVERAEAQGDFRNTFPVEPHAATDENFADILRLASGKQLTITDACQYLSEVGLCAKDYIKREVNDSLSGGELKRIEIATVLARGTKLSIFDEPEAGIDLWSFQNLIAVFERMRHNIKNGSILIISHQERILDIADEIVVIANGQISMQGPKDDILPHLLGTASAVDACTKFYNKEEA